MTKSMYFKVILVAFALILLCGCGNNNTVTNTPGKTETTNNTPEVSTGISKPTATHNSGEEIHFSDLNLESVVRTAVGKSVGPIMKADVESITKLSARVRGISNIDALKYFVSLEELDLYGNRITDLTPISNLTTLKKLNLGKNYNVLAAGNAGTSGLDLNPIKNLALLEELDLSDNMITDISCINNLTSLTKIVLTKNRISDITSLSNCKKLIYVDLSNNYGINADNSEMGICDLSPLYGIDTIETVIAVNNIIEDISGIEALENLSYLDLSVNFINNIEPLNELKHIKTVVLHSNGIVSIDCFENNSVIEVLDVSQNMIKDFDVILTMKKLKSLNWSQNNIQDYGPIEEFEEKNK